MFFKKSLWLYLLGMFVIASVSPLPTFNIWISGIIYFLIFLIIVVVPLYHFSTVRLVKLLNFDADAEFTAHQIVLRHRNKDLVETKDWSWISKISFTGTAVVLLVNQANRFLIFLDNKNLTAQELAFFTQISNARKG